MKIETIQENCQRLMNFFKSNPSFDLYIKEIELTPHGLLELYSRLLDVNGCNKSGFSILFIQDKSEFSEFRKYALSNINECMDRNNFTDTEELKNLHPELSKLDFSVINPPAIMFWHNEYYWTVINK